MGYRDEGTIYRLVFPDREGLVVRVTAPTLGEFTKMLLAAAVDTEHPRPEDVPLIQGIYETFAKHLVSWNLEDADGNSIPATLEGLQTRDMQFINQMMRAWQNAVAGIPTPKDLSANGGGSFPTVSIPMETLSPSQ